MDQNTLENFKDVTAATMRALAHEKNVDVQFTGSETPDHLSDPSKDKALLPLPPHNMDAQSKTLIRGAADSKALYLWHHDTKLHNSLGPNHPIGRAIFDSLEKARYETLGSQKMEGVAHNLQSLRQEIFARKSYDIPADSSPSVDPANIESTASLVDCLYALAQNTFVQDTPPQNLEIALSYWKPWLDTKLGSTENSLQKLTNCLHNQKQYAEIVRDILDKLDMGSSSDDIPPEDDNPQELETDEQQSAEQDGIEEQQEKEDKEQQGSQETQQTDIDETSSNEQAQDMASEGQQDTDEDMPAGGKEPPALNQQATPSGRYFIYTTKFDEIVDAHELADNAELHLLRTMLDSQMQNMQGLVSKLANRLQRKLMARQQRNWQFDIDEGYLDSSRLSRLIANPTVPASFKQEKETKFRDSIVSILIDNSGSMRGRPIAIAAICADIIAKTLERCGVKVEILGFTTRAWKGGKSRDLWIENGRPDKPGRLNDLRHIIYKAADAPLRRSHKNLGLMLKEGLLKENIDGEALVWAHNRISGRPEMRKILMVISDGAPVDDSTLSVNSNNILERDLCTVIDWIEATSDVQLTAIGIGHDVTRYYQKAITINDADELANALIARLEDLFNVDYLYPALRSNLRKKH